MTTNDKSNIPLAVAMVATVFAVSCLFLSRSYRIDHAELDRLANEIYRAELMVEHARSDSGEWTPTSVREAQQQVAELGDRLSEIQSNGPEGLPARVLELLAFAGMFVSIFGNGLFIYQKATN